MAQHRESVAELAQVRLLPTKCEERPTSPNGLLPDVCLYGTMWVMKRTALFLKEEQIKKLQKLSDKTGAPVAELIRRAIDRYVQERSKELN